MTPTFQSKNQRLSNNIDNHWMAPGLGPPPSDIAKPGEPLLAEYTSGGRVAILT